MVDLPAKKVLVVDASVLINLLIVDRVDLLLHLPFQEFVVPEDVEAEITDPANQGRGPVRPKAFRTCWKTPPLTDATKVLSSS